MFLKEWLPAPKNDSTRARRMILVSLLSRLGQEASNAIPIMAWTVRHDESASVRELAVSFFTSSEDEHCLLNQLPAKEKRDLLPAFLRDLQDKSNWGLRNNAALALRFYSEERDTVVPALTKALHDPHPQVALLAGAALARVAPDLITKVGVVPIVAGILKNPDGQIAYRAARLLGQLRADPSVAVPELIEETRSTNRLVATTSVEALMKFDHPAAQIRRAFEQAARRPDLPAWIRSELKKRLESMSPRRKGPNRTDLQSMPHRSE